MPRKKTATKTSDGSNEPSKSDFIREKLKAGMSPVDIVATAKEAGVVIAPALVYKVKGRSAAKKTKGKRGPKPRGKPGPKPKNGISASNFVRSMPVTMKAKDVVAAAKSKGIKVSPGLVYMVRSAAKKKAGGSSSTKAKPGRKPRAVVGVQTGDLSAFKKMALDLGIATARQALDELERGLAALLG